VSNKLYSKIVHIITGQVSHYLISVYNKNKKYLFCTYYIYCFCAYMENKLYGNMLSFNINCWFLVCLFCNDIQILWISKNIKIFLVSLLIVLIPSTISICIVDIEFWHVKNNIENYVGSIFTHYCNVTLDMQTLLFGISEFNIIFV
jgi:hypothetical protein